MENSQITIRGLKKSYGKGAGKNEVLKGINLNIDPGQIIGYIGPNGAGKSTTVKILCGILPDFEGEVTILGKDLKKEGLEIKKHKDYRNTDCPGVNFPFDAMLNTAPMDFPGAQYFGAGKDNEYILMLDKALIAKEYAGYYKLGAAGASTSWGAGSQKACTAFQLDQGWSGSGADGIPGPQTWQRLFH